MDCLPYFPGKLEPALCPRRDAAFVSSDAQKKETAQNAL